MKPKKKERTKKQNTKSWLTYVGSYRGRYNTKSWFIDVGSYCGSNTGKNEPRKEDRNTTNKRQQQKTWK